MEKHETAYLLELISEGDTEAFKVLFEEYFPKVKVFLVRFLKDDIAAEDISQDIFVKIWMLRAGLPELKSFDSYLYRVVRNAAINHLRSNNPLVTLSTDSLLDENSLEEDYYKKEKELLIRLVVERMPVQRRRVFTMSRYHGKTNDEIAQQLNISKKSVENQISLALRDIRGVITAMSLFLTL